MSTSQLKKNLIAARALVARSFHQGCFAANERGIQLVSDSRDATKWCSVGAIRAVRARSGQSESSEGEMVFAIRRVLPTDGPALEVDWHRIVNWHDAQPNLAAVLRVWDKAIAGAP